jgi:two-component system KDP operon response regulator KdpE
MRVLVIDDDPDMTELIKLNPAQYKVLTANSASVGLALARESAPEVIILDLVMPEMEGWEVCKDIRTFSNVPILILSALDNPGKVAQALDAGADDFLIKPVTSGVLIAHLQNLYRRFQSTQGELIANQSLQLH